MAYDLKSIDIPRLAGLPLKALVGLLESSPLSSVVRAQLTAQAGVHRLRTAHVDEGMSPQPVLPWRGGAPEVALDLAALAGPPRAATSAAPIAPSIADYAAAYRSGATSPIDVAERFLAAHAKSDVDAPPLRAFIAVDAADVRAQARAADERIKAGRARSILDGVPVAVKDEVDMTPYRTTAGTRVHGAAPATTDAFAVARLRAAGALLVGKANMHELGIGVTGLNPWHGTPRNPYDPARHTGGSSSGSACAVAAGLVPLALGADGGGSIRQPAALCGVVGLKPTWSRISEGGAAPICWSVGHLGPIGWSVRDVAVGYAVMAGRDPHEPATLAQPPLDVDLGDGRLDGVVLGVYRPWFQDAQPAVVARCEAMLRALQERGARVQDVVIDDLESLRLAHLVTIVSEMRASQEAVWRARRGEYALDTRLNLALADGITAADYAHAQRHRTRVCARFARVLQDVHAIVTPTTGITAPLIAQDALAAGESNLAVLQAIMRFAPAANFTGLPAITFPAGFDDDGLPVGFQAMGRPWDEGLLLRIAAAGEACVERRAPRRAYSVLA